MGIKLDWQVESEQTQITATEDPDVVLRRKRARRRLLILVGVIALILASIVAAVIWRLRDVDEQYRKNLEDTVAAEVIALRAGDYESYMVIQRSASDTFLLNQQEEYREYQELKPIMTFPDIPEDIVDLEIDNLRGRVVLEERINGDVYHVVWFYWYYEDEGDQSGWRRVPDDLTFWGDDREIKNDTVRVTYRDLDHELAEALAQYVPPWWSCTILQCATPPPALHIDIAPERPAQIEWAGDWTLRITSPLTGRARVPMAPELAQDLIREIAARMVRYTVGDVVMPEASDAAWLESDLTRWLTNSMMSSSGAPSAALGFTDTLIVQSGPNAPALMAHSLRPETTFDDLFITMSGIPLASLSLEQVQALYWLGFFQHRLDLEHQLLSQPESGATYLSLYDLADPIVDANARSRLSSPNYLHDNVQVTGVLISRDTAGDTFADVQVTATDANGLTTNDVIRWHYTAGTWKRRS